MRERGGNIRESEKVRERERVTETNGQEEVEKVKVTSVKGRERDTGKGREGDWERKGGSETKKKERQK